MEFTAKQLAQILGGTVEGDPEALVTRFAKIEHGRPGSLSFYANPKYEEYVYTSKASVLLVNADFVPRQKVAPTMVRVQDAYSAVAELLKHVSESKRKYRRHRAFSTLLTCGVSPKARLGRKVWVGDYVRIGARSRIGDCGIIHSTKAFHTGLHDLAERIASLGNTVNIFIIRDFTDHIRLVLTVLNNGKRNVRF